jgi:hypothetical protein
MSDRIVALIRTAVPAAVGAAATWIAKHFGVQIDTATTAAIATAAATSVYYELVHTLELRWPKFGVLLGVAKTPSYGPQPPAEPLDDARPAPLGLEQLQELFPPGTQIVVPAQPAIEPKSFMVTVDDNGVHVQEKPASTETS